MRLAHSLALAMLACAASALPASAKTLKVPQQFSTIQAAVNAARPGDTVQVSAKPGGGVYNESVSIQTPNIVLQGKNAPVIDGTGLGSELYGPGSYVGPNGINVDAGHVALRGLTVQNFDGSAYQETSGIAVSNAGDVEISACTVQKNFAGINILGLDSSGDAYLTGYKVLNNLVTLNTGAGVITDNYYFYQAGTGIEIVAGGALVSGNRVVQNTFEGIVAFGEGLSLSSNEVSGNANEGVQVSAVVYNPSVNDPNNPNPPASAVAQNSIHDNGYFGLSASGTVSVSANAVARNVGYGIYLASADYANVTLNSSTGNLPSTSAGDGTPDEAGVGIYVDYSDTDPATGLPLPLTISANQVSGNASDGISLNMVDGCLVSRNVVTGNAGIGIHLSDETGYNAPNTVAQNVGLSNRPFDAQDDDALASGATAKYATPNHWVNNLFGKTNPPNLSH